MVTVIGSTAPAPMPCTPRKTMSAGMLQATPHSTEPTPKTTMPNSRTGRRPRRSATFPYSGTVTAWVSR